MKYDRILLDIDSQRDLLVPGGSLYAAGGRQAAKEIRRLFAWARTARVPVISTVLRVRSDRIGPLGTTPHCVEDTRGERKLAGTILLSRTNFGLLNTTDLPDDLFDCCQQTIFEQRVTDIFAHSRLERLITELGPTTFVICGAGLAHGILEAAVGLRTRGFEVIVAQDAAAAVAGEKPEMPVLCMEAKGVIFAPTSDIVAPVTCRTSGQFRPVARCDRRRAAARHD